MYLADTLNRAYLTETHACGISKALENVDHTSSLAITKERLLQIQYASTDDPVLVELRQVVMSGWPDCRAQVPEMLRAYYDFRDELTVQDQLVFKGQMLIVPAGMRKEMLAGAHATHIGMEGCLRRAREIMFWPRMASELKEYISKCDICMRHRESQSKEPLQSYDVEARPWAKVGADLCDLNGRTLLVCCDYYSNFIEVENITNITTRGVCKAFRAMFARYGVPDVLVTDNGPQFASSEFSEFAKMWGFDHVTSSPRYPQSNGKGENAVKTVKRLFKKCQESGKSEYLALLDWRNMPTEGFGTSPAQRFWVDAARHDYRRKDHFWYRATLRKGMPKHCRARKTGRSATTIAVPRSSHQWVKGKLSTCVYLDSQHGAGACVLDWWAHEAMGCW